MVIILTGVSGSGKTTIGQQLAAELSLPFYDADDFHPPKNVKKMAAGKPLTDIDREPWLEKLARQISLWNRSDGAVLACSALKQSYRDTLSKNGEADVIFIYLMGSKELIRSRMNNRKDHYMPPSLLDSQFNALEEPKETFTVSVDQTPDEILEKINLHLRGKYKP